MAYFNLDSKTNLLPLPPPPRSTAAESKHRDIPAFLPSRSRAGGEKKEKVMRGQTKGTIKSFSARPIQVFCDIFWKGKSFSGIIVLTGEKEEVSQLFFWFVCFSELNKVRRRNHCRIAGVEVARSPVPPILVSDPRHFVSQPPSPLQPMFRALFVFAEFVCVTEPHEARPSEVIGIAVIWPP